MKRTLKELEASVIKYAKKWHDYAISDCEYGRNCKKHAGVCPLMYAVSDLLAYEREKATQPKDSR